MLCMSGLKKGVNIHLKGKHAFSHLQRSGSCIVRVDSEDTITRESRDNQFHTRTSEHTLQHPSLLLTVSVLQLF